MITSFSKKAAEGDVSGAFEEALGYSGGTVSHVGAGPGAADPNRRTQDREYRPRTVRLLINRRMRGSPCPRQSFSLKFNPFRQTGCGPVDGRLCEIIMVLDDNRFEHEVLHTDCLECRIAAGIRITVH